MKVVPLQKPKLTPIKGRYTHFNALCKKNWLIWCRTMGASLFELFCPVVLMAVLALTRMGIGSELVEGSSNIHNSTLFYPVGDFRKSPTVEEAILREENKYGSFANFSNINLTEKNMQLNFMPINCLRHGHNEERPIIAYTTSNLVTFNVLNDISVLSKCQSLIWPPLSVQEQKLTTIALRNTELRDRVFRNDNPFKMLINFRYLKFETEEKLMEYVRDPNYMTNRSYPGICFGFGVQENSDQDYQVKMFFTD